MRCLERAGNALPWMSARQLDLSCLPHRTEGATLPGSSVPEPLGICFSGTRGSVQGWSLPWSLQKTLCPASLSPSLPATWLRPFLVCWVFGVSH